MNKAMKQSDADLITTGEAAAELGVSTRRVIQFLENGRLPIARKVGRNYLIRRGDLKLVANRQIGRPKKKAEKPEKGKSDD